MELFPEIPESLRLGAYPYTFARVSAMKSKLVRAEDYQKLLKMPLAEIGKFLEEREYKKEIDTLAVQYAGVELLTRALDQHFANIVQKLRSISDEELVLLMDAYLLRRDMGNIKTILRGKQQELPPEQIRQTLQPGGVLAPRILEQLLAAPSIADALQQLAAFGLPEPGANIQAAEHQLDAMYYQRLLELATRSPRQGQRFTDFLLNELDNRNLFTMLRLRQAGLPIEEIRKHLLPQGRRFRLPALLKLAALPDDALTEALAAHKVALDPQQIASLEVQHAKSLLDSAMLLLHQHPLSVDVILGFLFAKEIELRNLRMIITGKHLGVNEQFLEQNLVIGG